MGESAPTFNFDRPFGLLGYELVTLKKIEIELTKVKNSIQTLAAEHTNRIKDLVDKLLAQAKADAKAGNPKRAAKALDVASTLIAAAEREKLPASDDDFGEWVSNLREVRASLNNKKVFEPVHKTSVALAEYRSSLQPPPVIPPNPSQVKSPFRFTSIEELLAKLQGKATVFDGRKLPPGGEFFRIRPPLQGKLSENVRIIGLIVVGASQTLDGIHWQDVVFVNTHIRYAGGEVELNNVRFVKCTFEIIQSNSGERLAQYVALKLPSLRIMPPIA